MPEPDDHDEPAQLSAAPFAVALAGFVVVAVIAFVFLRSEDEGTIVRPDRIDVAGDATVRALVSELPECERIVRAQFDDDEEGDRLLLELVSAPVAGCESDEAVEVVAEVTFPEPIGDRTVEPGIGRSRLPCTGDGDVTCGPEQ